MNSTQKAVIYKHSLKFYELLTPEQRGSETAEEYATREADAWEKRTRKLNKTIAKTFGRY